MSSAGSWRSGPKIGLTGRADVGRHIGQGNLRPKRARVCQDYLDDETREYVAELSRWEIAAYGYDFAGDHKPVFTPDPDRISIKDAYFNKNNL